MIPSIKICGITRVEDAEAAVAAGASYLGLVFVDGSPRKANRDVARRIVQAVKGKAQVVGVFQDATADVILDTFATLGLDLVQYHGGESPELIKVLALPAIKAFEIDERFTWKLVAPYIGIAQKILLDRPKFSITPDWLASAIEIAAGAPDNVPPYFFAGGLTAENVRTVVRKLGANVRNPSQVGAPPSSTDPGRKIIFHAVDVASGVEQAPGIKDISKLESFCQAVREEATRCEP